MNLKFTVDPDDKAIEFISGNTNFWDQFNQEPDMIDLDNLINDMSKKLKNSKRKDLCMLDIVLNLN